MGRSIEDASVTGDLEAQQHNPKWLAEHRHLLREGREKEDNTLGYFLWKVPESRRQPPDAFTPCEYRFGLHNRENLDPIGSEGVKLSIAVALGLVGQKWDRFCDVIVDDWKSVLLCYGFKEGMSSWREEEIKHVLALDALYLAVNYDINFPRNERRLWTAAVELDPLLDEPMFSMLNTWGATLADDICRIENQVPFALIQRVVKYFRNNVASLSEDDDQLGVANYLEKWMGYAAQDGSLSFMDISVEAFRNGHLSPVNTQRHILGAVYEAICGHEGLQRRRVYGNEYIHIPSATRLRDSGIKIKGVAGPLFSMRYENKCLFLPKMSMCDGTVPFIRNMAWYEERSVTDGCMFHDYVTLLIDLIQTSADVEILSQCGVVSNSSGVNAFQKCSILEEGLYELPSSRQHRDMKANIKKRCEFKRYRLWSEFRTQFCSKPWLVMSTIAIVLVTVATLIQTYIAIIGSNGMKPQFPH